MQGPRIDLIDWCSHLNLSHRQDSDHQNRQRKNHLFAHQRSQASFLTLCNVANRRRDIHRFDQCPN